MCSIIRDNEQHLDILHPNGNQTIVSLLDCTDTKVFNKDSKIFSPCAYFERLQTFSDSSTYFAKPIEISPLLCARFGWKNVSKNIIKCAVKDCGGTICVEYHPLLRPESVQKLTKAYREKLATSHQDTCPFRYEAERWLFPQRYEAYKISDDKQNIKPVSHEKVIARDHREFDNFIVPPYLLSLSPEFGIIQDESRDGWPVKSYVGEMALEIHNRMQEVLNFHIQTKRCKCDVPISRKNFNISLPKIASDFVSENIKSQTLNVDIGDILLEIENYLRARLIIPKHTCNTLNISQLHDSDLSKELNNTETSDIYSEDMNSIRIESVLLAVFGWRIMKPDDEDVVKENVYVKCGICLSKGRVPRFVEHCNSCDNEHDGFSSDSLSDGVQQHQSNNRDCNFNGNDTKQEKNESLTNVHMLVNAAEATHASRKRKRFLDLNNYFSLLQDDSSDYSSDDISKSTQQTKQSIAPSPAKKRRICKELDVSRPLLGSSKKVLTPNQLEVTDKKPIITPPFSLLENTDISVHIRKDFIALIFTV
eukprot:CAMPEP_0184862498 /NCGR_PEP_ID=MMETSP0580-20130426/6958_1 /TAXON_ID=1118495 /ORGANISM="Dactyliosolen fragilissimus" /LENGTH=534 /DNA_ID=CAMNT_0027360395 /DNA_START=26 /DNA_END=1631 /DNA_ORIENTATION=+